MRKIELTVEEDVFQELARFLYYKNLVGEKPGIDYEFLMLLMKALSKGEETLNIYKEA